MNAEGLFTVGLSPLGLLAPLGLASPALVGSGFRGSIVEGFGVSGIPGSSKRHGCK